jgi:hypothetical protein
MFQTEMNKEDMLMRDIWESIKEFFARDWTPAEKVLVILCCIMLGVIKGFCLAPIKRGISCGNNNGNSYVQTDDGCWNEAE